MKTTKPISNRSRRVFRGSTDGANGNKTAAAKPVRRRIYRQPKTEAEQAIQRYADLFDFAPIGYVTFDRVGRIEEINFLAVHLLGRSRRQLIGTTFALCVAKEDRQLFLHHLLECRLSRDLVVTELHLRRTDSEKIPVQLSSASSFASMKDGARLYQTAIFDLSERNTAEAALREKEAELELIVTQTPFMLTRCTRDLRYRYVSHAYAELVCRKPEEIAGKPIVEIMGEEGLKTILPYVEKVLRGNATEYEMQVPFQGIGARWLRSVYTPDQDSDGNVIGWFASIVDISERKRREYRLAEQARLLDLSNDAILVRDAQDRITYWNRGARELYGYSPEEALGKVTHELLRTEHPEPLTDIRKKLQRDNRWRGELVHTCKDGTKVVVISRWSVDRDANGRPSSTLETNTEITERKRAEQQAAVSLAVTRILSESPALTDAVPRILQAVCETLEWEVGGFWIPVPDGSVLRCHNVWESSVGKFSKFKVASMKLTLSPGVGLPGRVWSNLKAAWVPDVTRGNNFPRSWVAAGEGLHGSFAFPISFGKQFLAVMEFLSSEICEPDETLLKTFASISSQMGQFMQRKRAEEALQRSNELLERRVRDRTHELHTANKELKSEIERRKGLEGEILAVSDREQQRLGQELHDGLCQHLTAVAFMARSMALRLRNHRVIDAADIEKIAALVNDAAVDSRNLSRALHRADIDSAGLVNALQDLVDREIWRTPCRLEVKPSFRIEDDAAAANLYRIAQEAVINANKHAHARQIVVKLERSRKEMVLRVMDDGVGFPKDLKQQQGLGYHIMNYRAQLMGGRLEIDSRKTGGTCVSCYLPVHAPRSRKGQNGDEPAEATSKRQTCRPLPT